MIKIIIMTVVPYRAIKIAKQRIRNGKIKKQTFELIMVSKKSRGEKILIFLLYQKNA